MLRILKAMLAAVFVSIAIPHVLLAADPDTFAEPDGLTNSIYVGLTFGEDFDGFPVHMTPDYESTSAAEKLDITLPLYVTWILDASQGTESVAVDPPQPITEYPWFDHEAFQLQNIQLFSPDALYNECPDGQSLEAPLLNSYPLTEDGELNVVDTHGGIASKMTLRFRRCIGSPIPCSEVIVLYVGWASPRSEFDHGTSGTRHLVPGNVWQRASTFSDGPTLYQAYYDAKVVEWVSSDMAGTSPRAVDSSDISAFAAAYGSGGAVRWGHENESPATSPTFHALA